MWEEPRGQHKERYLDGETMMNDQWEWPRKRKRTVTEVKLQLEEE